VFHSGSVWRLPLYAITYTVIYSINAFLLEHLISDVGVSDLWAQAILVFPMAMLTFVGVSIVLTGRLPFLGGAK
jgi:hypothetical protein